MDQKYRFALFLAAMKQAAAAHDKDSARALLAETLNRIEETHSGVPYDPEKWMTDGRMYPPQDDQEQVSPISDVSLFYSRKHCIWVGTNGAVRFERRHPPNMGLVELDKPGRDGKYCGTPDLNLGNASE